LIAFPLSFEESEDEDSLSDVSVASDEFSSQICLDFLNKIACT
jgi:hypothetical protein